MKIVFFGTPPFAAEVLKALIESSHEVLAIVTRPDKPKGRSQKLLPSAVKETAQELCPHIPLYQPAKASTDEFAEQLKALEPDCFVVVAYGEIIKKNLLDVPKKYCLNVHASLLPQYRGAAPMQRALMNGEKKTGITIMEMVEKMDAGDMFEMAAVSVDEEMTLGELEVKLCQLAKPALLKVLGQIEQGIEKKSPQDPAEVTFAPKITQEDRQINWSRPAEEVHNQIRALSPQPGAYCFAQAGDEVKRLSIKKARVVSDREGKPGDTLVQEKDKWIVACGQKALALLEIQLEGKKSLSIETFLRGQSRPFRIKL